MLVSEVGGRGMSHVSHDLPFFATRGQQRSGVYDDIKLSFFL